MPVEIRRLSKDGGKSEALRHLHPFCTPSPRRVCLNLRMLQKWKRYLGLHDYVQDRPDRPRGVRPQRRKLAAAAVKAVIQMPLCQVLLGPEVPSRQG